MAKAVGRASTAIAQAPGSNARALGEASTAIASGRDSTAVASGPRATAHAEAPGAQAVATGDRSRALASHPKATATSDEQSACLGSTPAADRRPQARATVAGAVASRHVDGQEQPVLSVAPRQTALNGRDQAADRGR